MRRMSLRKTKDSFFGLYDDDTVDKFEDEKFINPSDSISMVQAPTFDPKENPFRSQPRDLARKHQPNGREDLNIREARGDVKREKETARSASREEMKQRALDNPFRPKHLESPLDQRNNSQRSLDQRSNSQRSQRSENTRDQRQPRPNEPRLDVLANRDFPNSPSSRSGGSRNRNSQGSSGYEFELPLSADIQSAYENAIPCGDCKCDIIDLNEAFDIEAVGQVPSINVVVSF